MATFMQLLIALMGILLIIAVLLQPGKGGGLVSDAFGGIAGQFGTMFGMRRTADFLQKFTIGLVITMFVFSILTNKLFLDTAVSSSPTGEQRKPVTEGATAPPVAAPVTPAPAPAQQQPAPAQQQPAQGK